MEKAKVNKGGYDGGDSRQLNPDGKTFKNSKPDSGANNKSVACNSPGYELMSGKSPMNEFPSAGGNPGLPDKVST